MGMQVAKGQSVNNKTNVFLHSYQDQAFSGAYIYTSVVHNELDLILKCSE